MVIPAQTESLRDGQKMYYAQSVDPASKFLRIRRRRLGNRSWGDTELQTRKAR
jgi:hypothetical protein